MVSPKPKPPILLEYLDIFKFLQDFYQFRKSHEPGFSYESWVVELGFQSRSYLRMALLGKKRISERFCQQFCNARKLSKPEEQYFHVLAKYSQASRHEEKKFYGQLLIQILRTCSGRTSIEGAIEFFSKPLYARLLVMLGFEDITPTAQIFARFLGTSEPEMIAALELLGSLHLASSSEIDGGLHWRTTSGKFDVPNNLGSVPLMRFHETSLMDSIEAFHQPKDLRRYKSILIPLSPDELGEFHLMVEDFVAQVLARFQSNTYLGRRLFQANLNFFSVAEPGQSVEPRGRE